MKCGICSTLSSPCHLRAWIESGGVYALACADCLYYRDNDTAAEFRTHAQRIANHRQTPTARVLQCPEIQVADVTYDQRRRDRKHRKGKSCKGISTADMRLFLAKNACYYCGGCATNVDRPSVDSCYSLDDKGSVAACASCNRRRRDRPRKQFISHMERVSRKKR